MASAIFGGIAKAALGAVASNVIGGLFAPKVSAPAAPPALLAPQGPTPEQEAAQKKAADEAAAEAQAKEDAAATEAQREQLLRTSRKKGRQSTILATSDETSTTGNLLGG